MKLSYQENDINTANLYLSAARVARVSPLTPSVVSIINLFTPERMRVEAFIKDIYKRSYNADMDILQTALRYHQIHSVVLVALGLYALDKQPDRALGVCAVLFISGIVIFSGSLYLMVLYDMPQLGKLTPMGGVALILGWLSVAFIQNKKKAEN